MVAQDPSIAGGFIRDVIEGGRDADVGKVVTANGTQAGFIIFQIPGRT
ncbi:hypothetical protein CJF32_00009744 [Rutstroemia sp. NJR-2017a WRK4]|nr:hypothetical protein CJF32_00009744 [Rutstroemia sp. NJR-2017a WRK4]